MTLSLRIYERHRPVFNELVSGITELGRQQFGEEACYCSVPIEGGQRVIIADHTEATISRRHVRLEELPNGSVILRNLSGGPISTDSKRDLQPKEQCEFTPPLIFRVGYRSMRLERDTQEEDSPLLSLANATLAPGRERVPSGRLPSFESTAGQHTGEMFIHWLQAAMSVFHSAVNSADFLERAGQAVIELVGLDTASVVLWRNGVWDPEVIRTREGHVSSAWQPSRTILDAAKAERRTFRRAPKLVGAASLQGVEALVAAPILDAEGEVIGALYGDRRRPAHGRASSDISELEAMLVELLASGVAAGLARLEQERTALAARVRFEQFFTPELAQQLESHPDLLEGRDAVITVLFCDVRGFSRISEKLGAVRTFAWICDVMEEFSECVQRFDGVLVDYIGDEVIAMWGAPVKVEEHATLACQAALEMVKKLDLLNERWFAELGEPISVGIGINSGVARVGNTGSTRKFKYGPLGNTVNLASRVQGATKHVGATILITGNTEEKIAPDISRRRLSRVRVVNIEAPVDLYEIVATAGEPWIDLRDRYEAALNAMDNKDFFAATKHLGNLVADYPEDGPVKQLLARAVNALISPDDCDRVWELGSK